MRFPDFCLRLKGRGLGVHDCGVDLSLRGGALRDVTMNGRLLLDDARLDVGRLPDPHHDKLVLALRIEGEKIYSSYLADVHHTNSEVTWDGGGLGLGAGAGTRALLDLLVGVDDMGRLPLSFEGAEGED